MPYIRIAQDSGFQRQQLFCAAAVKAGVFLHPHHNWFLGHAHSDAILEESLKCIDLALQGLAKQFSQPLC